ncbi:G-protein coupled receptor, putative [Plasmodium chabaudi adami]|uniref:G-protein coupled receptor, putative n=1 Tax=Plasmodium chabaudi adami TaxID=5826 RepID=A0A1D3S1N6_PLACE|nr:G-protein coupled receptor, putative [Plasmodium chabaudi adami]
MAESRRYISNEFLEEFEDNEQNIILIKKKINEYSFKLNNENEKHANQSIYCGIGGILYMDIVLYEYNNDYIYLEFGNNIIKRINRYTCKNCISFLEGNIGVVSLSCVLNEYIENDKGVDININTLIQNLRDNSEELLQINSNCELLYGKTGYIYSLLFCKNTWINTKFKFFILKNLYNIMNSIFEYGLTKAEKYYNNTFLSLYFEWHKQVYLGSAHGYAGIFLILYKLILFLFKHIDDLSISLILCYNNEVVDLNNLDKNEMNKCKNVVISKLNENIKLIYKVVDEIFQFYLTDEYNVYSSVRRKQKSQEISNTIDNGNNYIKKKEQLIQWCHGNVGFIILLIELLKYKYAPMDFKEKYNQTFLEKMGFLIWKKGLLYKGFGLCHGISGNGIVFLYLYNLTNDKKWYNMALKYALFSIKYFDKFYNIPDRPNSLYEGYAGLVVFLSFIVNPHLTYFLGYDFPNNLISTDV